MTLGSITARMCGRFTQFASWSEIREYFDLLGPALNLQPRYNIAPSQNVAAVRLDADGKRELIMLRWGLVPFWAKDEKVDYRMINARPRDGGRKAGLPRGFTATPVLDPGDRLL